MKIVIISASIRLERNSNRVALFFKEFIKKEKSDVEILDLEKYQFPLFEERLKFQKDPLPAAIEFSEKIKSADGIVIVTPEYNGSFPASLKNIIDLLNEEWKKKPVAISTVSSGAFGGMQSIISIQFSLWKLQALTIPVLFPVAQVTETFDEQGIPTNREAVEKRAKTFIGELIWYITQMKK